MKTLLITALAATTLLTAGTAWAEGTRVDFTPSIGSFTATQNNLDEEVPGLGSVQAKYGSSTAYGGYLTIWFNDKFALEGTAHFLNSSLDAFVFGAEGSVDASIFYGTGRAVIAVGDAPQLQLSAGMGIRSASYDTNELESSSFSTGIIGAALLVPMGQSSSLRFGVDDYIYNTFWEVGDLQTTELRQQDIVYSVGITFHTGTK